MLRVMGQQQQQQQCLRQRPGQDWQLEPCNPFLELLQPWKQQRWWQRRQQKQRNSSSKFWRSKAQLRCWGGSSSMGYCFRRMLVPWAVRGLSKATSPCQARQRLY
jgi:hypothetical protein